MKKWTVAVFGVVLTWASAAGADANYAGEWSYQALNAGDTNFKVEQEGDKITFYRVLHPEFEGERYKLEHMYRGKILGDKIEGKLFVREEGMQDFEFLRPFGGTIKRDDRMIVDDLPLKRVGKVLSPEPQEPQEPEKPKYSKVIIKREEPKPVEKKPPPAQKPPPKEERAAEAPPVIPKLIPVANRIKTEKGRRVEALLKEGDQLFASRKYSQANDSYAAALKLDPRKVELLYKQGHAHGTLGVIHAKSGRTSQAREHYQKAIDFWMRAVRYDPYNQGAKENIRRARLKLSNLSK